jgi:pilus assembly protein CpaC
MIKGVAMTTGWKASLRALVAAFGLALAAVPAARAEDVPSGAVVVRVGPGEEVVARKLDLGIGRAVIVELPRDAKEVFVANPRIANAVVRSTRRLFLIGMADGNTSVFVMDAEGRQIAALEVNIGRDLNVLRRLLRTAIPNARIEVVAIGDSIVLTGVVDSAAEAAQAVDIGRGFVSTSALGGGSAATGSGGTSISIGSSSLVEGKLVNSIAIRGRDQVMLKVTVAEVQRTVLKQLGINLAGEWRVGKLNVTSLIDNPLPLQRQVLSDTLITAGIGNSSNISVTALERAGVLRTLAEPTLTAISGETAKFTAGGEIPIPTSNNVTVDPVTGRLISNIGIMYKPFGVSLVFTPIVMSEGRISMRVATEVSEIEAENQIRLDQLNVPAFRVRKAETTVELPSGASLVSAGLIQKVNRQVINGLPGLMNLPILGTLFRSRDYNRQETELMVIVTPFIAKPSKPGDLTTPNDGFADAHDLQSILLGRITKIYGVAGAANIAGGRYRGHVGFIAD